MTHILSDLATNWAVPLTDPHLRFYNLLEQLPEPREILYLHYQFITETITKDTDEKPSEEVQRPRVQEFLPQGLRGVARSQLMAA